MRQLTAVFALLLAGCAEIYMWQPESSMPAVSSTQTTVWAQTISAEYNQTHFALSVPPPDPQSASWQKVVTFVHVSDVQLRDYSIRYKNALTSRISQTLFFKGTERNADIDLHNEYPFLALVGGIRDSAVKPDFLIHTGDSAEVPTEGELYRFIGVANLLDIPWLNTVGNHDILAFGNFNQRYYTIRNATPDVVPVTSRRFFIKAHDDIDRGRVATTKLFGPHDVTVNGTSIVPPAPAHGFDASSGIGWYSIRLRTTPPVRLVVLDTIASDSDILTVGKAQVPGVGASDVVTEQEVDWLKVQLTEANTNGEAVLVFGHHPMTFDGNDIIFVQPGDANSREPLRKVLGRFPNVLGYFGGHTHAADVESRDTDLGRKLVEVTAPSMHEYPFFGFVVDILKNDKDKLAVAVRPIQAMVAESDAASSVATNLSLACKGAAKMANASAPCKLNAADITRYSAFTVVGEMPAPYPSVEVAPRYAAVCDGDPGVARVGLRGKPPWHLTLNPPVDDVALSDKSSDLPVVAGQSYSITSITDANHKDVPVENRSIYIPVKARPAGSIEGAIEVCERTPVKLSAPEGSRYEWNVPGATTREIVVTPEGKTEYQVRVTSSNGCSTMFSKAVDVLSLPAITINGGAAATLDVCPNSPAKLTVSPATDVQWFGPGVDNTHRKDSTLVVQTPHDGDEYTVIVTDEHHCSNQKTTKLHLLPAFEGDVAGPTGVCEGGVVSLQAPSATSYRWSTGAAAQSIEAKPIAPTDFYVDVTNSEGCTTKLRHHVDIWPTPSAALQPTTIRDCRGTDKILRVDMSGTPPWSITWSDGTVQSNILTSPIVRHVAVGDQSIEYSVRSIQDHYGCSGAATGVVGVSALPAPQMQVSESSGESAGTVRLSATGAATYRWSTGEAASSIVVSKEPGHKYTVTGASDAGCQTVLDYTLSQ